MGRPKGSQNVVTTDIKGAFKDLLEANIESLQRDIDKLSPSGRLDFFLRLSEYVVPKLARTEHTGEDGGEIKVQWIIPKNED